MKDSIEFPVKVIDEFSAERVRTEVTFPYSTFDEQLIFALLEYLNLEVMVLKDEYGYGVIKIIKGEK